jgi:hypothetical protein
MTAYAERLKIGRIDASELVRGHVATLGKVRTKRVPHLCSSKYSAPVIAGDFTTEGKGLPDFPQERRLGVSSSPSREQKYLYRLHCLDSGIN